mgnify:CR=1 FL=1
MNNLGLNFGLYLAFTQVIKPNFSPQYTYTHTHTHTLTLSLPPTPAPEAGEGWRSKHFNKMFIVVVLDITDIMSEKYKG